MPNPLSTVHENGNERVSQKQASFSAVKRGGRTAEARQRYQEYLDRFPWGERAQEAQAALERLGGE